MSQTTTLTTSSKQPSSPLTTNCASGSGGGSEVGVIHHHPKPKLTVQIDSKQQNSKLEAHKIDLNGNLVVDSPLLNNNEKIEGKKQLKTKLLSEDSSNDEGFHMEIETYSDKKYFYVSNNDNYNNHFTNEIGRDISLDRLSFSIDSMKSVGSVDIKEEETTLANPNHPTTTTTTTFKTQQPSSTCPKKCPYHQEMDASWICDECQANVCELCSMSKMATDSSTAMICHHCFDERAKNWNLIYLIIGAFCLGIVFPPLLVAAPVVIIMRSHNVKFKRIGWILFWLVVLGVFLLFGSGFITTISLKYAGKF